MLSNQREVGPLQAWRLDQKAGIGTTRRRLIEQLDPAHECADVVNLAFHKLVVGCQPREFSGEDRRIVGRDPKRDRDAQTSQLGQLSRASDRSGGAVPKHRDPVGEMLGLIEIVGGEQNGLARTVRAQQAEDLP